MFGGVGIYADDVFFALIANDALYFKADASASAEFEARGMGPFRPFGNDGAAMQYYQVPEDIFEDLELLRPWAERALDIARRSRKRASKRRGV